MASDNLPRAFGNGDDEKEVVGLHENAPSPDLLPPDPDAHLSDEEKAAIVRLWECPWNSDNILICCAGS